jgi:hypothetical protein
MFAICSDDNYLRGTSFGWVAERCVSKPTLLALQSLFVRPLSVQLMGVRSVCVDIERGALCADPNKIGAALVSGPHKARRTQSGHLEI